MRYIIILLLSMVLICPSVGAHESELKAYITDFMQPISKTRVYKPRLNRALKLIPVVIDRAKKHQIDPLLVAVIISFESSWDFTVTGKLGERGLMQTHGKAAHGFDMDDPAEQIAAGVNHLARALEYCQGDVPGALTRYGTGGECRPVARFVKWRLRAYERAVKRYRR